MKEVSNVWSLLIAVFAGRQENQCLFSPVDTFVFATTVKFNWKNVQYAGQLSHTLKITFTCNISLDNTPNVDLIVLEIYDISFTSFFILSFLATI
mmetsp:Transcript_30230/g.39856  ORF Transcript_30230/g.39856 Transcript_30230/m.39856 type:complete len:95 (-) Transcript_30230:107-391(-)